MNRVRHFLVGGNRFRKEVIKQLQFLITVTIGFTISFSWRQTTFDASQTLVQKIFGTSGLESSLLTSVFITIFGIALIVLSAYLLKEREIL